MSVDNGKVCCNCRHCIREYNSTKFRWQKVIECKCEIDNRYLNYVIVMTYWCRHWAKERKNDR